MKRKLALALTLVMLLGSLLSVAPIAAGESEAAEATERYVPKIEYANVNYNDSLYMMFAVAPPAELAEGESVKLLVWDSRDDSLSFSYLDTVKTTIDAEAEPVTIGEQSYLLFKFDGIDITDMTNVICARPILVKDGVASSYGKLVDYSVREYVESVKGNINGVDGIEDENVIDSLDKLLSFGSLAQQFSGNDYKFLADDEVKSIYVTTIVNGLDKGTTFAGFFKSDDSQITIRAPFIDGTTVNKITDAEGNVLEDLDAYSDDLQIATPDSDIYVSAYYANAVVRNIDAASFGAGFEVNNYDDGVVGGNGLVTKSDNGYGITFKGIGSANFSGVACEPDTSSLKRMNYWHSIKTVASPDNPDDLVLQLTGLCTPAFNVEKITPADFSGIGFGDTVYPAFTFEMTLGSVNGKLPNTGKYYFRQRVSASSVDSRSYIDLHIFTVKNGDVTLASGDVVGTVPETGMRRFAITVDALTGMTYGYAEDENGVMQATCVGPLSTDQYFNARQAQHFANLADEDPSNDSTLAYYENIYSFFTKSPKLEPTWVYASGGSVIPEFENASIEIDGVDTPIKNSDGTFNMDAVKALAERDYSFLIDDFRLVMGFVYE